MIIPRAPNADRSRKRGRHENADVTSSRRGLRHPAGGSGIPCSSGAGVCDSRRPSPVRPFRWSYRFAGPGWDNIRIWGSGPPTFCAFPSARAASPARSSALRRGVLPLTYAAAARCLFSTVPNMYQQRMSRQRVGAPTQVASRNCFGVLQTTSDPSVPSKEEANCYFVSNTYLTE